MHVLQTHMLPRNNECFLCRITIAKLCCLSTFIHLLMPGCESMMQSINGARLLLEEKKYMHHASATDICVVLASSNSCLPPLNVCIISFPTCCAASSTNFVVLVNIENMSYRYRRLTAHRRSWREDSRSRSPRCCCRRRRSSRRCLREECADAEKYECREQQEIANALETERKWYAILLQVFSISTISVHRCKH